MQKENFKWRSFVSFGMFFSFLIMALTGLLLYVAPSGRVFRWTNWHLLGLDLTQWRALHTLFSYLFIGFAIAHIFSLNWKVLFSYFTRKTNKTLRRKRELILSLVFIALFFAGSVANFQPFKAVMDLGDKASALWGKATDNPPIAYLEQMPIDRLATEILEIEVDDYLKRVEKSGYVVDNPSVTLADAAKANRVAPYVFFRETTKGLKVLEIPGR
jgi:hypothetical protein